MTSICFTIEGKSFPDVWQNESVDTFSLCSVDNLNLSSFPRYSKDSSNSTGGILWLLINRRGLY